MAPECIMGRKHSELGAEDKKASSWQPTLRIENGRQAKVGMAAFRSSFPEAAIPLPAKNGPLTGSSVGL